ncbi:sigma factor-like helix-turn-helix DNA-binding protein [Sphingomonas sp. KR3-1]|uniref:RNA polymerase sigma factor n=1 Tax=Sphingomonas sp. KR3-1 TaxID=3156611 RepID=UPI0032B45B90
MSNDPFRPDLAQRASALVAAAQVAATAKDALAMVEALHVSGYLAGLKVRVHKKWPKLPAAEIDDCVAEAVESSFAAVSGGRKVGNLGAWLWKAVDNIATDRWNTNYKSVRELTEDLALPGPAELHPQEREEIDTLAEHRRAQAIVTARRLLASVGHGQVRDVVELIIDAVEAGEPDLSSEVVADTLGISRSAARSLMSRGLDRLRTAARAEGIEIEALPTNPDNDTTFDADEDTDQ